MADETNVVSKTWPTTARTPSSSGPSPFPSGAGPGGHPGRPGSIHAVSPPHGLYPR